MYGDSHLADHDDPNQYGYYRDRHFCLEKKKTMWFWSGSTVDESEIADIPAYNRANGIMWICYSAVFWVSTVLGIFQMDVAGIVLAVGCLAGIPLLIIVYGRIYRKYRNN